MPEPIRRLFRSFRVLLCGTGLLLAGLTSCSPEAERSPRAYIDWVNPFIGTGGHGHTFPGATLPFGMMQLSPDTRLTGWDGCSGYHFSDSIIYGFSHTHLSGTGVSDYGDVLLMPANRVLFNNGADDQPGYRSKFSHRTEKASPGYYEVHLEDPDVHVELTASKRSGIHRYQFSRGAQQVVILDLAHRDRVMDSEIVWHDSLHISGRRFSSAWAEDQRLFFDLQFSRPFTSVTFLNEVQRGESVKAAFEFDAEESAVLELRIGISAVDEQGAERNRVEELGDQSFEQVHAEARTVWERQLSKIEVETYSDTHQTVFYTALYHALLAPNLYQDVDGRYRGMDMEIHRDSSMEYYTVFSLWDTYRAAHPLYTLIEPERTQHFIRTFLKKYREGGILPIWDLSANYTGCMIGYHAVSVITDAYLKGLRDYDVEEAFLAMVHSAMQEHLGLGDYQQHGFIAVENEAESVSKTLEYAYDDWSIAQMALALGRDSAYAHFLRRAQNYKNVYDPETQFMRGRFRNQWFSPFDPYEVNFNYTEANAWQYAFYVPQDVSGHIGLMGGQSEYEQLLDRLFNAPSATSGRNQQDISGLIGQYAHGNEPSHHMAYLYNFVNRPEKTQQRVRQILTEQYANSPEGISGNEDCGQMSAWYVFSALGFYPVTPGSPDYIIGSPLVKRATLHLENGRTFEIEAPDNSEANSYVAGVTLHGEPYTKTYLTHTDIQRGGTLHFQMQPEPSSWGRADADAPVSSIDTHLIVPPPYIQSGEIAFLDRTEIELACAHRDAAIYYSIGGDFLLYERPFVLKRAAALSAFSVLNGDTSVTITTNFYQRNRNLKVTLNTDYSPEYSAGGPNATIDGIRGSADFRTGTWQGYYDTDFDAVVDLGETRRVDAVTVNFLCDQSPWIFLPKQVCCYTSLDGETFVLAGSQRFNNNPVEGVQVESVKFNHMQGPMRYIRITAEKVGALPDWHIGSEYDGRTWLFVDEIQID